MGRSMLRPSNAISRWRFAVGIRGDTPLFFVSADSKGVRFAVSPLECTLRRRLVSAHSKGVMLTVAGGERLPNIVVSEASFQLARVCARLWSEPRRRGGQRPRDYKSLWHAGLRD